MAPAGEAFENSVAARIVFAVVEETPLAVAWLMLVIMVIPFKYWNNAYSFAGFLLCFLLAVASGMRKRNFRLDLAFLGPWIVAFGAMILMAWPCRPTPPCPPAFCSTT